MEKGAITLKPDVIKDYFYYKNDKIIVLENNAFVGVDKDILILAKLVEKDEDLFIESLSEEEYDKAAKKYELLNEMLEEEDENV